MRTAIVLAFLSFSAAQAQRRPQRAVPAPDLPAMVEVVALNAQGRPVTNLTRADFHIFEDGKLQDIASVGFSGTGAAADELAANEVSNDGAGRGAMVILFDFLGEAGMTTNRARDQVVRAIGQLDPAQPVYLYALANSGDLVPIHGLPENAGTAADNAWKAQLGSQLDATMKRLIGFKTTDQGDIFTRGNKTFEAMRNLAQRLAEFGGRKSIIWVSAGIPKIGHSSVLNLSVDLSPVIRQTADVLEAARVSVYTVDQTNEEAAGAGYNRETLQDMSGLTGGRPFATDHIEDAVAQAADDESGSYQIAYYRTAEKPDGKYHKLRVTCSRPGVRLQTEQGFYADPPAQNEKSLVDSALHASSDGAGIGIRVTMSHDPQASGTLHFQIKVDAADLILREQDGKSSGQVQLLFAAYGPSGFSSVSSVSSLIPVNFSLTAEQVATALHGGIEMREALPVNHDVQRVRVIVYDRNSNSIGWLTIPVAKP